jgi:integrase
LVTTRRPPPGAITTQAGPEFVKNNVPAGASSGDHTHPALGRIRLAKLTVADLDRLWKAKRDAGYSSNSVRIMRTVLRRALGQAVREGIVSRNVAGLSVAPRIRAREGRTLTVDQARQPLDAAAGYRFEAAVVLALAYGMRRGDVLGLR